MYCFVFALAVLPPLYQSTREIQAILTDPHLAAALGSGEVITAILRTESGYEVETIHYRLRVDRAYLPQQMPGPARFQLEFHAPEAKTGNN